MSFFTEKRNLSRFVYKLFTLYVIHTFFTDIKSIFLYLFYSFDSICSFLFSLRNRQTIPRPLQNRQPHRFSVETDGAKLLNGITTGEQASRAMRKTVL
jgi:hypothetical protein